MTVLARPASSTATPPGPEEKTTSLDPGAPELTATAPPQDSTPPESTRATAVELAPIEAPPESPPPESAGATAADLAPIDNPPTDLTPGLAAVVAKPASGKPVRSARRVVPPTARSRAALTVLVVAVPLALLVIGGTWLWVRRRPAPPPPVVVEELPLPPAPPVAVVPPPAPAPAPAPEEPTPPPAKAVPMLAGKPVVLEYDAAAEPIEVAGANPAAVAKARAAYRQGNARMAAKDRKGAVKAYRASLKHYPAYVGAYRGLGRALAASGDKKNAIKVLKLYVQTVPEAEDVAAINALIEKLGKKPSRRGR